MEKLRKKQNKRALSTLNHVTISINLNNIREAIQINTNICQFSLRFWKVTPKTHPNYRTETSHV